MNTRLLLTDRLEGIGWFCHEVVKRITRNHPEHEFIFIFDRPYHRSFIFADNITPVVTGPQARHPVLWYMWFEWSVPKVLKKYDADVFISPEMFISLRANVPSLLSIHDLSILHYPEYVTWFVRKYFHHYYPRYAKKAAHIATVSEYSKRDIIQHYGVDEAKIDVVYNGAHEMYEPLTESEMRITRELHADGREYFLYVGALHPRKNIARLLAAFDAFKKQSGSSKLLLLAGRKGWMTSGMEEAYEAMAYKDDVRFLGYQPLSTLARIVASAYALAYVSLFEGFGIPLVEAMNCHVPSVTARVTSMPEVAGNTAILVDPTDVEDITKGLLQMNDAHTRYALSVKCEQQKRNFSWNLTAQRFWKCVEKVMPTTK